MAQRMAGFGTWSWDVATDTLVWSSELYRIYGLSPETFEPTFERFIGRLDARDRGWVQRSLSETLASGEAFEHEERIVRSDGVIRLLRSTGRVERDDAGRPLRMVGACLDITEQRAASDALAAREAELRRALAAARMGVFTWEVTSRRLTCSAEIERFVGARLSRLDDLLAVLEPDERERLAGLAERARRSPQGHVHLRFRAGPPTERRWLQLSGAVRRMIGQPVIEGTIADVTEEAALEARLVQARRMETVGRLAGGVAHDFNNLLTVILAETEMLLDDAGIDDAARESMQAVSDAARRAAELTERLLSLSRERPVQLAVVDVAARIRGAADLYRRVAGERVDFRMQVPTAPVPVLIDRGQLDQVLVQLITNAREAMPEGGRMVVRLAEHAGQGGDDRRTGPRAGAHVSIEVADTGRGVPGAIADRIFDPFFSTKAQGTGLGLSACHGIVERHGGALEYEPASGGGTVFRVVLPLADGALPSAEPDEGDVAGTERVLLVEDESEVRRLAVEALRRHGYRVHAAKDGRAALELLDSLDGGVDLVVSDVVMPRMGGVALAGLLEKRLPGVPVLFMSGYTADAFPAGGLAADRLLRKPFTPVALARRVRALLDAAATAT